MFAKEYKNVLDEAHDIVEGEVCIKSHTRDAARSMPPCRGAAAAGGFTTYEQLKASLSFAAGIAPSAIR